MTIGTGAAPGSSNKPAKRRLGRPEKVVTGMKSQPQPMLCITYNIQYALRLYPLAMFETTWNFLVVCKWF